MFLLDPERDRILEANAKACHLLGYSRQELLHIPISAVHPDGMPQLLAFVRSEYYVTLDDRKLLSISSSTNSTGGRFDATRDRTGDERLQKGEEWRSAPVTIKFGRDEWSAK